MNPIAARPTHPGRLLARELTARGWTQKQAADLISTSEAYISDLVAGRRGLSARMAIRLGVVFRVSPEFWWQAQCNYELAMAKEAEARP